MAAGSPFCPQCNAPQIRVATASEREQVLEPVGPAQIADTFYETSPQQIRWSAALARTAAAAVASIAMLQLISVFTRSGALAFLALPLGGWFAVYLYSRRQLGPITAGMGARLGAVTGFLVFLIAIVISAVGVAADRDEVFAMMQKAMKDAAAANPNPQAEALIKQISTPSGMMTILVLAAILFLFASVILCSLGGAAGASIANRSNR